MNSLTRLSHSLGLPRLQQKSLAFLLIGFVLVLHALLFTRSPLAGLGLLVALFSAFIFYLNPFLITLAFVFSLGSGYLLHLPVTQNGLALSTAILLAGFPILVLRSILIKDYGLVIALSTKPRNLLVLSLFSVTVISLVNSSNKTVSFQEIQQFAYCVIGYFVLVFTVTSSSKLKKTVVCFLCMGSLVSFFGCLEAVTQNIYVYLHGRSLLGSPIPIEGVRTKIDRIEGFWGGSNSHGIYMVVCFVFFLYVFLSSKSKTVRSLMSIALLATLFNIFGSGTRSAVLALLVSLVIFWTFLPASRKWLLLAFGSGAVFLFFAVSLVPSLNVERIYTYEGQQEHTAEIRWTNTLVGLAMVPDHPFIGSGPWGYRGNYYRYAFGIVPEAEKNVFRLHNAALEILVNYGIVGFTISVLFVFLTTKQLFLLSRQLAGRDRFLVVAVFGAVCSYCLYMLSTGWLVNQTFWMLMALGSAACNIYEGNAVEKVPEVSMGDPAKGIEHGA